MYEVSREVNSATVDTPDLLRPMDGTAVDARLSKRRRNAKPAEEA